jgi:hypothetical protein
MIGQYGDRLNGERASPTRLRRYHPQIVDTLRQQSPATFEQGNGEEEGSPG